MVNYTHINVTITLTFRSGFMDSFSHRYSRAHIRVRMSIGLDVPTPAPLRPLLPLRCHSIYPCCMCIVFSTSTPYFFLALFLCPALSLHDTVSLIAMCPLPANDNDFRPYNIRTFTLNREVHGHKGILLCLPS